MKISIVFLAIFLSFGLFNHAFGVEAKKTIAHHDAYFDSATGHKYIKNSNSTYREYSKKGKLLNDSVPNTRPLLSNGKYIQPIEKNCYILYETTAANGSKQLVLPADSQHPEGWRSQKLFYSTDYTRSGLVQAP